MTPVDWQFAYLGLVALVAAVVCGIAWKVAYEDGWQARGLHDSNTRNLKKLSARDKAADREADDFDRWIAQLSQPRDERLADTAEMLLLAGPGNGGGGSDWDDKVITDTGSFRVVTDSYITRMQAEEAAYRDGLAS